jgi:hypothetical protein
MDKAKLLKLAGEADMYAKDIEAAFPKAQNKVNSLKWVLKGIRDELNKPEPIVIAGPITVTAGGDPTKVVNA